MNHGMGRTFHCLKGLLNNVLPGLGQHLHRHIVRNHIFLNERPHKLIFRLRGRRKSDLNLLEPNIH